MPPLIRRLTTKEFLIVVSCALSVSTHTTLAWAQHTAGRTAPEVHMSAPPISRVPISSAPIMRAPISIPRFWVTPSVITLGNPNFRPPRRPIRPFPPVVPVYEFPFLFGGPLWGLNSCWSASCNLFGSWTLDYTTVSSPGPSNSSQVYETPEYVYGEQSPDLPQLVLKDGTILNVTDYWFVDDQLHFEMIEENGAKPAEHVIPFEALDLQATVDTDTRRGFRFVLRNEPLNEYLRDHPEGSPPGVTPKPE